MTGRTGVLSATVLGLSLTFMDGSVGSVAPGNIHGGLAVGTAASPDGQGGVASGSNNAIARVAGMLAAWASGILAANARDSTSGGGHVVQETAASVGAVAAGTIGPHYSA